MADDLIVPPTIEEIIQRYETTRTPFTELQVHQKLVTARNALVEPSPGENLGAWAELLAFGLTEGRTYVGGSPWGTHFAPIGSMTYQDGTVIYSPDIAGTPPDVVGHWSRRARSLSNPLLKARYADLVWDMARPIAKARPDPDMARIAIDAYLESTISELHEELHDRVEAALRAFDLSRMINDADRLQKSRAALLALHRQAVSERAVNWARAYDRLMEDRKSGLTDAERDELVADAEGLLAYYSNASDPKAFDPNSARDVATRLAQNYARTHKRHEIKRIRKTVAEAFEHSASLASPMLASAFLQTAVDAYRDAGLGDESQRVRIAMQNKVGESRAEMASVEHEVKIAKDDVEKFLSSVVVDGLGQTFANIAVEFLLKRAELEKEVSDLAEKAPLLAHITQSILADDRVAAIVGSVENDPFGRLFHHANFSFSFSALWLDQAFLRAFEKHDVLPEHFVGWANRHDVFDDTGLLLEGVRAWAAGDFVKSIHVLVPQIERALRGIVGQLGRPTTKAHPTVAGASVAIGLGDILYWTEITSALGPDLTLHLQALYADPRGLNLRNELAHGLLKTTAFNAHLARLVMHTLLLLGVWKELSARPR